MLLVIAAGFLLSPVRASGELALRPLVRQASTPMQVKGQARPPRRAISQRVRASSARRRQSTSPWPRAKLRHMVSMAQLVSVGRIKRSRSSSLHANRRPVLAYMIDVDQLLRVPARDGDLNHQAANGLGVPVIRGVPPIVIIAPSQRERNPLDAARRRAR
jgi:hypothetical protein